jgi:hypothetical protein
MGTLLLPIHANYVLLVISKKQMLLIWHFRRNDPNLTTLKGDISHVANPYRSPLWIMSDIFLSLTLR